MDVTDKTQNSTKFRQKSFFRIKYSQLTEEEKKTYWETMKNLSSVPSEDPVKANMDGNDGV